MPETVPFWGEPPQGEEADVAIGPSEDALPETASPAFPSGDDLVTFPFQPPVDEAEALVDAPLDPIRGRPS
jgi:hypothetical protein